MRGGEWRQVAIGSIQWDNGPARVPSTTVSSTPARCTHSENSPSDQDAQDCVKLAHSGGMGADVAWCPAIPAT